MSAGPTIDYDALAQEAMRGVVRTVLVRTAKTGLPGDHHFYISFDTQQPGVVMSKRLKDKYPQEMTIVLQHRFWDLAVTDERFEVKLTFDGIPERLVIPFNAIKVFFDPSVSYGLQFEDPEAGARAGDGEETERRPTAMTTRSSSPRKPRSPRARLRDVDAGGDAPSAEPAPKSAPRPSLAPVQDRPQAVANAGAPPNGAAAASGAAQPGRTAQGEQKGEAKDKAPAAELDAANKPAAAPAGGAQIVSLDAFRKK